jgi:enoyl-CoA hydratase/carnithine racemase
MSETRSNEFYECKLEDYAERYKDWMIFRREDGILEMRLHTDGGSLKWGGGAQQAFIQACQDIDHDPDNELLIITGTDDVFLGPGLDASDPRASRSGIPGSPGVNGNYPWLWVDYCYHAQTQEPLAVTSLHIPVINAVNGPIIAHPELALCGDIVICSENTTFTEAHFEPSGMCPGDGTWALWRNLIGPTRARYMMWMGGTIDANKALEWGVVSEVLPLEKLNDRAWEIARKMMQKPRYARRFTHIITNKMWRDLFTSEMEYGMAHEALAALCDNPIWAPDDVKR